MWKRSVTSATCTLREPSPHEGIRLTTNRHKNVNSVFQSASPCTADSKHIRPPDLLVNTLPEFSESLLNGKSSRQTALFRCAPFLFTIVYVRKLNPEELIGPSHPEHKNQLYGTCTVDTPGNIDIYFPLVQGGFLPPLACICLICWYVGGSLWTRLHHRNSLLLYKIKQIFKHEAYLHAHHKHKLDVMKAKIKLSQTSNTATDYMIIKFEYTHW